MEHEGGKELTKNFYNFKFFFLDLEQFVYK